MAVPTNDNYCLFAAAELTRIYVSKEVDRQHIFPRLLTNPERVRQTYILPLIRACGIPEDLPSYNIEDHLRAVQDYYDRAYYNRYEIILFDSYSGFRPRWRGHKDRRQVPLFLYFEQLPNQVGHFYGIRSVRSFLGKDQYCIFCEAPFKSKADHRMKCKAKCANCSEIGYNHPCAPDRDYLQPCPQCDKTFRSPSCFTNHLRNRTCQRYRQCTSCGVIHSRAVEHECGSTYCRSCHVYHSKEAGCYIPKLKPAKAVPYRICIYDFETSQDQPSGVDPNKFEHFVNFVCCTTICSECIRTDRWQRPLSKGECLICGDFRKRTWSVRPFTGTPVCRAEVTDHPLAAFVQWILHGLNKRWTTVALAHNAGRFDAVLVLGELYNKGNLCPTLIRQGTRIFAMEVSMRTTPT